MAMEEEFRPLTCLICQFELSPKTPLEQIHAGDFAVCPECGMILIYKGDLAFRFPTWDDLDDVDLDCMREMQQLQARAIRKMAHEFDRLIQSKISTHLSN